MFGTRVGFIVFSVMFIVTASFLATSLDVEGIECDDPEELITQPDANTSTFQEISTQANGLTSVLFGCSSTNQLLNGFFLALQGGMVLVLLMILKDVIPFT